MGRDGDFMRAALALARRGLGNVAPNPAVGCILVRPDATGEGGRVVGRGWTQPGGRPHAETEALARAGSLAAGATAYVSLEPCDHTGRTGPCSQALIDAGIARAVVAIEDPDPRVAGRGIRRMEAAGIEVTLGVEREAAARLNRGFFLAKEEGRPMFTLKTASTLDGRTATHSGHSKWITGPRARAFGHRLRAEHDAIMVGSGTALADDPMLTCRLPGMDDHSPVRIVFDSRLRLPLTSKLVAGAAEVPVWLITLPGGDRTRRAAFADCGVEVIEVDADDDGYPDLQLAAQVMAGRGLTRVLVEGGSHLAAEMLRAGLVDEIAWMRSGGLIGGDGLPAVQGFGVDTLEDMPRFRTLSRHPAGADWVEFMERED